MITPCSILSDKLVDDLLAFLKDLRDPEGYGFSVTEEVHAEAHGLQRRLILELATKGE